MTELSQEDLELDILLEQKEKEYNDLKQIKLDVLKKDLNEKKKKINDFEEEYRRLTGKDPVIINKSLEDNTKVESLLSLIVRILTPDKRLPIKDITNLVIKSKYNNTYKKLSNVIGRIIRQNEHLFVVEKMPIENKPRQIQYFYSLKKGK